MNTEQASQQADIVVKIEVGSKRCVAFAHKFEGNEPVKYYDNMNAEITGLWKVLHIALENTRTANFYLKRLIS